MITIEELEKKYDYKFPKLYKILFEAGMLDWMRGYNHPLGEGKTWAEDVYPTLKENPPLLLHTGGADFELLTPEEVFNFEFPEDVNIEEHHFVPIAKTAEGDIYAFYANVEIEGENPVVLIWDEDETEYIAKNFEDFIFRKMLEVSDGIDKDDLHADYDKENAMENYRKDIQLDSKSIRLYIKEEYASILEEAYNGEVLETLIAFGFVRPQPLKEIFKESIDFEKMGETFDHDS